METAVDVERRVNDILNEKKADELLERVINLHFDDENGTPYWIKKAKELNINPKKDLNSIDALHLLGHAHEDALRYLPISDFIPKSILKHKKGSIRIGETGGTTGTPKRAPCEISFWTKMMKFFDNGAEYHGIPKEIDIFYIGPTGPHPVGWLGLELPKRYNSLGYTIDLDTRFIKKAAAAKKTDPKDNSLELYMKHMGEQIMPILQTQKPGILFTTAKIIEILVHKVPDASKLGIKGIIHGGIAMSPDTQRIIKKEIFPNVPLMGIYGNSLLGVAIQLPNETNHLTYYPMQPHNIINVMRPDEPLEKVNYGERGQVMFHRMSPEFFMPNVYERDEATRVRPTAKYGYDWDGVQDVSVLGSFEEKSIEGVY